MVRKSNRGGAVSITVVLRPDQKMRLQEMSREASRRAGHFVSASELARDALDMYTTTRVFFDQKYDENHSTTMNTRKAS